MSVISEPNVTTNIFIILLLFQGYASCPAHALPAIEVGLALAALQSVGG